MTSPLGLPLDQPIGRQHTPSMDDIAAAWGTDRRRGGERVEHLCPECGLIEPDRADSLITQICRVCDGRGVIDDARMSRYLRYQG